MKFLFTILFAICLSTGFSQKVFSVDYASQADVKVYVVDYESQADLSVYKVDYASQAGDNDGSWFFVDYESQSGAANFDILSAGFNKKTGSGSVGIKFFSRRDHAGSIGKTNGIFINYSGRF